MNKWTNLRGKSVIVRSRGVTYTGVVVEMGERTLVLRTTGGFHEIDWEGISSIEECAVGASGSRRKGSLPVGWY